MIVRIVEIVGYIPPPDALSPRERVRIAGDKFCPKPVRNLRRVGQQRVDLINFNSERGEDGGVWVNLEAWMFGCHGEKYYLCGRKSIQNSHLLLKFIFNGNKN